MTNKELGLHIYGAGEKEHDLNYIYGYNNFSYPKEFEGFYVWYFTKTAEENFEPYAMKDKKGKVTVNGKEVPFKYTKKNSGWNPWMVAVDLRKLHFESGKSYTVTISDFETESGEIMESVDTVINCIPKFVKDAGYKNDEHDNMSLITAQEGAVLLKNEGNILPLKNKKINVFGDAYYRFFNMSGGAGSINPIFSVGFIDGLTEYGGFELNPDMCEFFAGETFEYNPDEKALRKAKEYSDIAVITIARGSKEDTDNDPDKGGFYLTDEEEKLICDVSAIFEKTVVILNVGYTIDVRWVEKYNIKAVLWFSYGGQLAGQALADILSGKVTPSGHLPDTWAYDYFDYATSKNYILNSDIEADCEKPLVVNVYEEGLYVGYRYFDTFNIPVAYPFGYGLSYTDFDYTFNSAKYENGVFSLSVSVKNTGNCSGKQVLQLYVKEPDGKLEKCAHKLVDFRKTKLLNPQESDMLNFEVCDNEFASFDSESASEIMEKGEYKIYIGEHINSLTEVFSFALNEDKIIKKLHNYCVPKKAFTELSKFGAEKLPGGELSFCDCKKEEFDFSDTKRKHFSVDDLPKYDGEIIYYEDVEKNPELLDKFIAQMSVDELARINVCAQAWAIDANNVAGSVYVLDKYKMKHFYTADGNSTLRMNKRKTGFPCSNMICASFNREMAYAVGRVVAEEAYEEKIHMILAPGMNIHRNPLCGRNAEYFSEDPVLCGIMAGYHIKGLQDNKVGAVIKHVIANNAELSRYRSNSVVSERALREIYVKCFEIAMDICVPDGLMTSYNALNDCYTGMDEELMLGIFREELNFDGVIMTDWNSYNTCDPVSAVSAGNCWLTPGSSDCKYTDLIVEGVKSGKIELSRLQDNVKRFLNIILKYTKINNE